ncbi:hypothetical protein B0H15DRAFT_165325 [Mycena belliarum]|uniref:Uncharacterized protein n=1 Tax=Mycena belliarum TaxID=1033014 RepID=A0AAD6U7K1_9AGAR|nr:hypothetical protein B0H15DRAFT_165325 [Mycena belliae]
MLSKTTTSTSTAAQRAQPPTLGARPTTTCLQCTPAVPQSIRTPPSYASPPAPPLRVSERTSSLEHCVELPCTEICAAADAARFPRVQPQIRRVRRPARARAVASSRRLQRSASSDAPAHHDRRPPPPDRRSPRKRRTRATCASPAPRASVPLDAALPPRSTPPRRLAASDPHPNPDSRPSHARARALPPFALLANRSRGPELALWPLVRPPAPWQGAVAYSTLPALSNTSPPFRSIPAAALIARVRARPPQPSPTPQAVAASPSLLQPE